MASLQSSRRHRAAKNAVIAVAAAFALSIVAWGHGAQQSGTNGTQQGIAQQGAAQQGAKTPPPFVVGQTAPANPTMPAAQAAPPAKLLPNPSSEQIAQLIQEFMGKEKVFRDMLAHSYVYTESIKVEESDINTRTPTGSYEQVNDIQYSSLGQRQVVCTFCPQPTMKNVNITEADIDDFFNMDMYTFTSDQVNDYTITYVDHEPLDQISAYVFQFMPKKAAKGTHYFQGKVWVDDRDIMIVKTAGKAPDEVDKHGHVTNYFLPFTTWRQEIDGKYWFPVYTQEEGEIPADPKAGAPGAHVKMVIQFKDYKMFHANARIISTQITPQGNDNPPTNNDDSKTNIDPKTGKPVAPTIPHEQPEWRR